MLDDLHLPWHLIEADPATTDQPAGTGWILLGTGFGSSVYANDDQGVVLRVARVASTGQRLEQMAHWLRWLGPRLTVAIPRPLWFAGPGTHPRLPYGAMIYRKLPGTVLAPGAVSDATIASLADVLVQVHSLPVPDEPFVSSGATGHPHRDYATIRDELRRRLAPAAFTRIEAWRATPQPPVTRPTVIHGDYWWENILVDAETGRVTGVLDWEGVDVGDPAQDLVPFRDLGRPVVNGLLAAYVRGMKTEDPTLDTRLRWWWEARYFGGLHLALAANDLPEVDDAIRKIREGPILDPHAAW